MHFYLRILSGLVALGLGAETIRLTIADSSGATVPATVKLTASATGVTTTKTGNTDFEGLAPGRYRIEIHADGFAARTISADLAAGQTLERKVVLAIGPSNYKVDVVSASPLPGMDRSLDELPGTIQTASAAEIENSGALNLPDFLNRRLNGVYLNEIQGNPFQMDLNYRGFTASPLLGTPQGISIYMDGVRVNQPFGDVMSWDLIPRTAIAEMSLVPGSNPLFGLNTLGGALAIETKDGRRHPGTMVQVQGGSFGRKMADLEHGGSNSKGLDWYLASSLFFEDGWRESSPSNVRQFLGKLGWQGQKSSLSFTTAFANNSLTGNGLQEARLLERNRSSVYTKPDLTKQKSPWLNLRGRRALTNAWSLSGNIYYRYIDANTLNGDINEESLDQSLYTLSNGDQAALRAAGYTGFPTSGANAANTPFPFWRCIAQVLQRDEPSEKCNGLLNRSNTTQYNYGFSGQASWNGNTGTVRHQVTLGAAWDANRVGFSQSSQLGYLNPDRSVTGLPAFGDGVTGGDADGEPFDTRVDLRSRIHTGSVYATNTMRIGSDWNLTISGRYNRTHIDNRDRITPGGGRGSLDGKHTFQRFNPAVGLTRRLGTMANLYFGYAEGNRAPTAIELGCADPQSPCRLPNALAGDPPLLQVVSRTIEAGVRGDIEGRWKWNAGYFRTSNRDDILFVSSEQTGFGYFKNFGRTLRQGMEAGINGSIGRASIGVNYTLLDATFRSPEEVNGTGNSTNEDALRGIPGLEGTIEIESGNRIPLTPRHLGKAYVDYQITRSWIVDLGLTATSSSFARGNENNRHQPDGRYYVAPGYAAGYAVTNFGSRYKIHPKAELFVQVNNLLNRRYNTAAQLGATGFTAEGNFVARPFPQIQGEYPLLGSTFYAPGAPRAAWAGIRFRF